MIWAREGRNTFSYISLENNIQNYRKYLYNSKSVHASYQYIQRTLLAKIRHSHFLINDLTLGGKQNALSGF